MKYHKWNHNGQDVPSLPPRGAWIEIKMWSDRMVIELSLPPRGAWIEIRRKVRVSIRLLVAPPTGSVD